jgi:hypothetical protein
MPLQNRVDPFGEIHAVVARGMFTGNRGVIHDPATKTLLNCRWTTKAWIICECDFRGRRREVMGRNAPSGRAGWTELFFLDEVTALAAGHRPCFYCRRERAIEFARCFAAGQGRETIAAPEMDAVLHRERWASRRGHDRDKAPPPLTTPRKGEGNLGVALPRPAVSPGIDVSGSPSPLRGGVRGGGRRADELPFGAMVASRGDAFARSVDGWVRWSFEGWRTGEPSSPVQLITPRAAVDALRWGYEPAWHSSALRPVP